MRISSSSPKRYPNRLPVSRQAARIEVSRFQRKDGSNEWLRLRLAQATTASIPTPNSDKLLELLGFDGAKNPAITDGVFGEALADIKADRDKLAKEEAKKLLAQAIELRKQMAEAKKTFEGQTRKFDKELGRVIAKLVAQAGGGTPAPEGDEGDNAQQQDEAT